MTYIPCEGLHVDMKFVGYGTERSKSDRVPLPVCGCVLQLWSSCFRSVRVMHIHVNAAYLMHAELLPYTIKLQLHVFASAIILVCLLASRWCGRRVFTFCLILATTHSCIASVCVLERFQLIHKCYIHTEACCNRWTTRACATT